jgi:hypothetical protein
MAGMIKLSTKPNVPGALGAAREKRKQQQPAKT